MTEEKVLIVVEGKSDKKFIEDFIAHLNLPKCRIDSAGSKDDLRKHQVDIERYAKESHLTALVIFDADDKNADDKIEGRRGDIKSVLGGVLPDKNVFLMPDNQSAGELETLLRKIIHSNYKFVLKCFDEYFDNYRECLQKECPQREDGKSSIHLPSGKEHRKASRHIYCRAVGAEESPEKTDYQNPNHWDLDSPALKPLKKFLTDHISAAR